MVCCCCCCWYIFFFLFIVGIDPCRCIGCRCGLFRRKRSHWYTHRYDWEPHDQVFARCVCTTRDSNSNGFICINNGQRNKFGIVRARVRVRVRARARMHACMKIGIDKWRHCYYVIDEWTLRTHIFRIGASYGEQRERERSSLTQPAASPLPSRHRAAQRSGEMKSIENCVAL